MYHQVIFKAHKNFFIVFIWAPIDVLLRYREVINPKSLSMQVAAGWKNTDFLCYLYLSDPSLQGRSDSNKVIQENSLWTLNIFSWKGPENAWRRKAEK